MAKRFGRNQRRHFQDRLAQLERLLRAAGGEHPEFALQGDYPDAISLTSLTGPIEDSSRSLDESHRRVDLRAVVTARYIPDVNVLNKAIDTRLPVSWRGLVWYIQSITIDRSHRDGYIGNHNSYGYNSYGYMSFDLIPLQAKRITK